MITAVTTTTNLNNGGMMSNKVGAWLVLECLGGATQPPIMDWNKHEPQPYKSNLTKAQQKKRAKKNKMQKQSRKRNR